MSAMRLISGYRDRALFPMVSPDQTPAPLLLLGGFGSGAMSRQLLHLLLLVSCTLSAAFVPSPSGIGGLVPSLVHGLSMSGRTKLNRSVVLALARGSPVRSSLAFLSSFCDAGGVLSRQSRCLVLIFTTSLGAKILHRFQEGGRPCAILVLSGLHP